MAKENKISEEKLKNYFNKTEKALEIARDKVNKDKKEEAKEILEMVENYLADAGHFKNNEDWVNAFACLNYCHGWLDTGARLRIFNVTDDKLFTI